MSNGEQLSDSRVYLIGGHACPRLIRTVSVSAIFKKIQVRVRVRGFDEKS